MAMLDKERGKYLVIAIILVVLMVMTDWLLPKPVNWILDLSSNNTEPFGTSVLKNSLSDIFPGSDITISRESFYEGEDSISQSILVIALGMNQGKEDFEKMMDKIDQGANVFIAAYDFSSYLSDSLGVFVEDKVTSELLFSDEDSAYLQILRPNLEEKFVYRRIDAPYSFNTDSLMGQGWDLVAKNQEADPVAISKRFGEGSLILTTMPLLFTNYYLLYTPNSISAAALLSHLPKSDLLWTEYYFRGRGEAQTPLRYVLRKAPLRWAFYLLVSAVFIFVFFEAKRKQRPIAILSPPKNDSLDFVKTVGNLYYESRNHKNISSKKIQYLLEHIRSHYNLSTDEINDPEFCRQLSHKSGKPLLNVEGLMTMIGIINGKDKIHEDELRVLNKKIEAFLE